MAGPSVPSRELLYRGSPNEFVAALRHEAKAHVAVRHEYLAIEFAEIASRVEPEDDDEAEEMWALSEIVIAGMRKEPVREKWLAAAALFNSTIGLR